MYTIKQFCAATNLSEVYVRRMILTGKLDHTKEYIPGTNIPRNLIPEEELARFQGKRSQRREDGRNRFVLHSTPAELKRIQEVMAKEGIGSIITKQKQYKPKAK
jgi:hypothetical protein